MYGTRTEARFFNIPICFSSAAVATISVHKNFLKVTPLKYDTTSLSYNTMFKDETFKDSLNSKIINTQEKLNGNMNLAQQSFQTPSKFVNNKIVYAKPTKTKQNNSLLLIYSTTQQR